MCLCRLARRTEYGLAGPNLRFDEEAILGWYGAVVREEPSSEFQVSSCELNASFKGISAASLPLE